VNGTRAEIELSERVEPSILSQKIVMNVRAGAEIAEPCVAFNPVQAVHVSNCLIHEIKHNTIVGRCLGIFSNPDRILREVGMDIPEVTIKAFHARTIPMKRQKVNGTIGTRGQKADKPRSTRWRSGNSGATKTDTLSLERLDKLHPYVSSFYWIHVGLSVEVWLIERQDGRSPLSFDVIREAIRILTAPLHGYIWDVRRSQIIWWYVVPVILPRYEAFRLICIDDIPRELASKANSSLRIFLSVVQGDESQT
jgi:hypothetical protein